MHKKLRNAIYCASIAEACVAITEFIHTPRIGCDDKQLQNFFKYFSLDKDGNIPFIYTNMVIRRLDNNDKTIYITTQGQSTDDSERMFSNIYMINKYNNFKDMTNDQIQKVIWDNHKEWIQDSVMCGYVINEVYNKPSSYEEFMKIQHADQNFISHRRLSLGCMMQAGPFCIFDTPLYVKLLSMSNDNNISIECIVLQYYIYRNLLLNNKKLNITDIIDLSIEKSNITEQIIIDAISQAKNGSKQILLQPNIECVHAIYSLIYVLLRATSYKNGISIGLYLSVGTHSYDTDTIANINGFALGLMFDNALDELDHEIIRKWTDCNPTNFDINNIIENIEENVINGIVHCDHKYIDYVINNKLSIKPLIRKNKEWTQIDIDLEINKMKIINS